MKKQRLKMYNSKEALLSQSSKTFSRRRRAEGKLFLILTSAGEFHHRSHLAFKKASTCVVATFWSFFIVISITKKVENDGQSAT